MSLFAFSMLFKYSRAKSLNSIWVECRVLHTAEKHNIWTSFCLVNETTWLRAGVNRSVRFWEMDRNIFLANDRHFDFFWFMCRGWNSDNSNTPRVRERHFAEGKYESSMKLVRFMDNLITVSMVWRTMMEKHQTRAKENERYSFRRKFFR